MAKYKISTDARKDYVSYTISAPVKEVSVFIADCEVTRYIQVNVKNKIIYRHFDGRARQRINAHTLAKRLIKSFQP